MTAGEGGGRDRKRDGTVDALPVRCSFSLNIAPIACARRLDGRYGPTEHSCMLRSTSFEVAEDCELIEISPANYGPSFSCFSSPFFCNINWGLQTWSAMLVWRLLSAGNSQTFIRGFAEQLEGGSKKNCSTERSVFRILVIES